VDVTVFGGSGYTGLELLRLLARHPVARVVAASSDALKGEAVKSRVVEWPTDLVFGAHDAVLAACTKDQIAFLATPAKTSAELAKTLLDRGARVIDLSGAHRLDDPALYPEWYGFSHPHPDLLRSAHYGLPEIFPTPHATRLVANPGCYATAAVLAIAPLLARDLVDPNLPIIIDGKSGVTGAGRTLDEKMLFAEVAESLRPYRVARHQHTPEIERALGLVAKRPVKVSFTAHLIPMRRGLVASVYVPARAGVKQVDLDDALASQYQKAFFVRVPEGRPPETGLVAYTGFAEVSATLDPRTGVIAAFSGIDNLGKGAAGQAIQNLNAMLGIHPWMGLSGSLGLGGGS
jgi:N-acetyl-gamma-glutamyl-phosphate reductase